MKALENRNLTGAPHILVIDDDDRIRALVTRFLGENGMVACEAADAGNAREIMKRLAFDALVVDIMMPGENGLDFTKSIRKAGNDVPVLLLTALGEAEDRVSGLETGADDYLPKPFEPRELVLRIHSIMKRRPPPVVEEEMLPFRFGGWLFDPGLNELRDRGGKILRLTTVEANLLRALGSCPGRIVTREKLAVLCGMEDVGARTIDVQVVRLRRKVEDNPREPRWLQTVRGKGYRLVVESV
ncbi:MAG: response regulator [Proteobacteria bacterium]|nr:response regulator [Pseudomonadota bacterium]